VWEGGGVGGEMGVEVLFGKALCFFFFFGFFFFDFLFLFFFFFFIFNLWSHTYPVSSPNNRAGFVG
jgi:hypothetical protein